MFKEGMNGFCMALADSVPGVSGGTVAFIMGFYDRFIGSIHDLAFGKMKEKGNTVVPLQVYFSGSLVKVEIGLAKGKKLYDKRDDIAKKDQRREAQRDFKVRNLG